MYCCAIDFVELNSLLLEGISKLVLKDCSTAFRRNLLSFRLKPVLRIGVLKGALVFFVVLQCGFGNDVLHDVGGHHVVMTEFHCVTAQATGHAA